MDTEVHKLLPHFLTLVFCLALPSLPSLPAPELDTTMEVLVLGHVGYIPDKGLYTCFTRMGGTRPDFTLEYSATYKHGPSKVSATCNGDVNQHNSSDGLVAYCLPPCPGLEVTDPDPMSITVTGHDRVNKETVAGLMEAFIFSRVTPRVTLPGRGVVEVQWKARTNRTYRVQLWHHPYAAGAVVEVKSNSEVMKTGVGEIERGGVEGEECDGEIVERNGPLRNLNNEKENEETVVEEHMDKEKGKPCQGNEREDLLVIVNEELVENDKSSNIGEVMESRTEQSSESLSGTLEDKSEIKNEPCGVMSNETLIKVKQCYHDLDKDTDDDDDDNNDKDDDNDHEDDNDDFLKFMRWRKCVALHAPCNTVIPASTSVLVHTSRSLNCTREKCVYYLTNTPTSGFISLEVIDVTDTFTHSSHTLPTLVQEWNSLTIDTVVVTSEDVEADSIHKTVTITLPSTSEGSKEGNAEAEEVEGKEEERVGDVESTKGYLQAVIINSHNQSEVLKSEPAECDLLRRVCSVTGLQTLADPKDGGPAAHLSLLLSNYQTNTSTFMSITDVQVRVHKVAPGIVVVVWEREPSIQEFSVRVVHESGVPSDIITIPCGIRGTYCLATFSCLETGHYHAEVSYMKKIPVVISSQFHMEEEDSMSEMTV